MRKERRKVEKSSTTTEAAQHGKKVYDRVTGGGEEAGFACSAQLERLHHLLAPPLRTTGLSSGVRGASTPKVDSNEV